MKFDEAINTVQIGADKGKAHESNSLEAFN